MASIYGIEYRYDDEYKAGEPTHTCMIVVYETGTPSGDNLEHAMECANEDGDFTGVDKLLGTMFGKKDDDICFYFDISDIRDTGTSRLTRLVPELQKSFDIIINDIWIEDVYE